MSWLSPSWTICKDRTSQIRGNSLRTCIGNFDCAVHISEEATNAAVAVPWAIVGAIFTSGILGWGEHASRLHHAALITCRARNPSRHRFLYGH